MIVVIFAVLEIGVLILALWASYECTRVESTLRKVT